MKTNEEVMYNTFSLSKTPRYQFNQRKLAQIIPQSNPSILHNLFKNVLSCG